MDVSENLSPRVLLKHILVTDIPRTPVTRSDSGEPSTSRVLRSSRLSKKDAEPQTPQDILRRSLKHKIRESITRKSLPNPRRRTTSVMLRKSNTSTATSVFFNDGNTPRHLLMNILHTEPVKSPVIHKKGASEDLELYPANNTVTVTRPSIELSGLDLPDVTTGSVGSTTKVLSRKRPRRSLNVTAFEKRLKDGDDAEEEIESSIDGHSSLSLSSSTSLSLKTPFADVRTEKKGLQRRVSNRRKITEEEFGAAVNRREMGGASSFAVVEQDLGETTHCEGFTLGLTKLGESDITSDIVKCNTALYDHTHAMTSRFSIVATQDETTVVASELQKEMQEMEWKKVGETTLEKDQFMSALPNAELVTKPQNKESLSASQSQEDVDEAEPQNVDALRPPEAAAFSSKSEEEEDSAQSHTSDIDNRVESEEVETEGQGAGDFHPEYDADPRYQLVTEEVALDSQIAGEKGAAESQTEEEEGAAESQTEEEEGAAESQTEADATEPQCEDTEAGSQTEEESVVGSQTNEDEEQDDEAESQTEADAPDIQNQETVEAGSQSEEDEDVIESQTEDEYNWKGDGKDERQASEEQECDLEWISQRAHRSEGAVIAPVGEMGEDLGKATAADSLTQDIKVSQHLDDSPPAEAPSRYDNEQAEWEYENDDDDDDDDESEVSLSKTPTFVREKMNSFQNDHLASPSVVKNIEASDTTEALPATKPKKVRQRKTGPTKKETVLPKAYLKSVFKHFADTKVSPDVYPVLDEIMDKFFERLAEDLEMYAAHAKRKTIEFDDALLLLKRQGYVNDKVPVEVLIEKYLRMEQRKILIPIATRGNVVIPKSRR